MSSPHLRRAAIGILLAAGLQSLPAQSAKHASAKKQLSTPITGLAQTTVVLGAATPVPLAESPRPVTVLPVAPMSLVPLTPLNFLRQDSSVFLQQRGAGGAQSDISIEGGSFEQTLVLLDGFRINDSETGHADLDLPVPLEAIDSIEVAPGAGSTLHGVDALSGVVDFVTRAPHRDRVRLRAGDGSFESNEESLLADTTHGRWSARLAADRNFSTGFMTDRDYRNEEASLETWTGTRLGITDILLATSDRAFGANDFYGNYPEWERTKCWFAAVRQELGTHTVASLGYRRHTDEFVLVRNHPRLYENNHIDNAWQARLRHTVNLGDGALLLMGLESDIDGIHSNNLGIHARNRGAGYLDLEWQPPKKRWNLSTGARESIFSGGTKVFSPQLSGSMRLTHKLKLRADVGYGFRIPTFTDLYYSDPTTIGNANLKPEAAWSTNVGGDWAPSPRLSLSVTGFYSRQHNTIDYVRANSNDLWHAANISGLHFGGVDASLTWLPTESQSVHISWTSLYGAQSALHGLQSEYIFNYPVENIYGTWTAAVGHLMTIRNMVQLTQRYQQSVYPVWNVWIMHAAGRFQPYLRLSNLSNTGYQEIAGVNMPPREIAGGFAIQFEK
jgi:iron complex outermembrane receptor protein